MNKKKFMTLLLCIIVVIAGVFILEFISTQISVASTLKKGKGTLVRDYDEYFQMEEMTQNYITCIKNNNQKVLKSITKNGYSKGKYEKLSKELGTGFYNVKMTNVYSLSENVYRCEFDLQRELGNYTKEQLEILKKYEVEIKGNSISIELNREKSTFKVINVKFNI